MTVPILSRGTDLRTVIDRINQILRGKINASATVTLTASATSTAFVDPRLGGSSLLVFSPRSATAALALTTLYVSAKDTGTATLTHNSTADTDRTFDVLIIG